MKKFLYAAAVLSLSASLARATISDNGNMSLGGNAVIGGTMTVQGNAFSVGGSTLVVAGGNVGIGTNAPQGLLNISGGPVRTDSGGYFFQHGIGSGSGIGALYMNEANDANYLVVAGTDNARTSTGILGYGALGAYPTPVLSWNDSGNVGIGTQSPNYSLDATASGGVGAQFFEQSVSGQGNWQIQNPTGANRDLAFYDRNESAPDYFRLQHGGNVGISTGAPAAQLDVEGNNGVILNSGNVGIGTTNPGTTLEVSNAAAGGTTSPVLYVSTGSAGAQKLFTVLGNGHVGVGTSSPAWPLVTYSAAATDAFSSVNLHNTIGDRNAIFATGPNSADTSSYEIRFFDSGINTQQGTITRNGSNAVLYGTSSDRRLKENIVPTHFGLADLMRLNVVDFNFKNDASKRLTTGLIAQDVKPIYPDAVHSNGDDGVVALSTGANSNPWNIDYGHLTPLLIKAIQDQQKEIENLQAQVAALKKAK